MKKEENRMTKGSIPKTLVLFALPLLGSSFVQQLYNTADMMFVGNFVNKIGAAAVGASSLLFTLLIGLFTGVSVGVGVVISQLVGKGDEEKATKTAHTAIAFSLIGGLILTVIGIVFARPLLNLMNTPPSIMGDAMDYLRIYFLSMVPMILFNMGSGIIRATGDSKTPFYVLIAGGLTNVAMDYLLIVHIPLGVVGAAAATCFSQSVTAVLILRILLRGRGGIVLEFSKLKVDRALLNRILYIGLPAGIQGMVITLSNIIVQFYINGYGENAVAAYAAYFKLENLLWMPIVALGQAVTTFSGQNTGAMKFDRLKRGLLTGILMSGAVVIAVAAIILWQPDFFLGLFSNDEEVIALAKTIIFTTFPFYWFYSILESAGGTIRGMGFSVTSMSITMGVLCGFRVLLLILNDHFGPGFPGVAMVYPITWGATALSFVVAFFICLKKKKAEVISA